MKLLLPVLHASTIIATPIGAALDRAGSWFLNSGIQEENGGVARYYQSDSRRNARVSNEITGYAVATATYLAGLTGDARYLDSAERAARYLIDEAWSAQSATFPFEPVPEGDPAYAYFFDCGIVARGLLAVWRATGRREYFDRAEECGLSMAVDFVAREAVHPILRLPEKQPVAHEARWSKRPGCYQLKAAMAWRELAEETGHRELADAFERVLAYSLATHSAFLTDETDDDRLMDRLHAYAYFLEGLLPEARNPECAEALGEGIGALSLHLRRLESHFVRSDVYAQLLRLRVFAARLGARPLDEAAADFEARRLAAFQAGGNDLRTAGGFWFGGKRGKTMPFANPVSTAFAMQALALWQEYRDGVAKTSVLALV